MSTFGSLWTGSLDGNAVRSSAGRISTIHDVFRTRAFPPMIMYRRRCQHCVSAFPRMVEGIPRIVEEFPSLIEGIPRRVPLSEAKDAPETVFRCHFIRAQYPSQHGCYRYGTADYGSANVVTIGPMTCFITSTPFDSSCSEVSHIVYRQADALQQSSIPDQVGWPVLIFGAVALAVGAEVFGKLKVCRIILNNKPR